MSAFDKRAFIYVRTSDEYDGNHPNFTVMKMNGFNVCCVRERSFDPLAAYTIRAARQAGIYPVLWMGPNKDESALDFVTRIDTEIAYLDSHQAYCYAIILDNEGLSLD